MDLSLSTFGAPRVLLAGQRRPTRNLRVSALDDEERAVRMVSEWLWEKVYRKLTPREARRGELGTTGRGEYIIGRRA